MSEYYQVKILVAHDDALIAAGLASTLCQQSDFEIVAISQSNTRPNIHSVWKQQPLDVVVADYAAGLSIMNELRLNPQPNRFKAPKVLIVTRCEKESDIRTALELGVHGYLVIDCKLDELVDAVRALHRGSRHLGALAARRIAESMTYEVLTHRETDVLRLVAKGYANKSIANELAIGVGTVKTHVKAILDKLHAKTRTEAASIASHRGLVHEVEFMLSSRDRSHYAFNSVQHHPSHHNDARQLQFA
jgi:DNA-binding NarL/FixJ family response regulator